MPIKYKNKVAIFKDFIGIEEAEKLLDWIRENKDGHINLAGCTHIHTSILQILMASGIPIKEWPAQPQFEMWLKSTLENSQNKGR